jgi:hypothetical protein
MLKHIDITRRQEQIIRGTILGGSSIIQPKKGRNCYLSMRCKCAQWLEYKARELQVLSSCAPFTEEKTYRWHSMCYPIFKNFRDEFYEDNKRTLKLSSLDSLHDIGLAIWFKDCGKVKNNKVIINTHIWGKNGTEIMEEYFDLIGYKPKIFYERKCIRIRLDVPSSASFLCLVTPHIPTF